MRYERDRKGVVRRDGVEVARVRSAWLGARARAMVGPVAWEFRERRGGYVAWRVGDVAPRIRMPSPSLFSGAVVDPSGPLWQLRMRGFSHTSSLLRDGVEVAVIGPPRNWTTRIVLDTDGGVSDEEAAFFLWVASARRRGD